MLILRYAGRESSTRECTEASNGSVVDGKADCDPRRGTGNVNVLVG